jgi:hypothetical protein
VQQSVGGGAQSTSDLQLDGSPTGIGVKNSYQPIPDTVEEVNVQQNAIDAEYGHSSGSAITITPKAGTNEWLGLAYYQGQYPWANALEDRVNRTINLDRKHIFGGTFGNRFSRISFSTSSASKPGSTRSPAASSRPADRTGTKWRLLPVVEWFRRVTNYLRSLEHGDRRER